MDINWRVSVIAVACMLLLLGSEPPVAADTSEQVPAVSPEKLEKLVKRRFKYVDERLLSGKSAKTIEQSGNSQAMEILRQARELRDEISEWIAAGKMEEAYGALQKVSRSMKVALQMSRAKERISKKARDDMESARVANDAYFELVKKRGLDGLGPEVDALLEQARRARGKAESMYAAGDLESATESYLYSTTLLRRATSMFRELNQ